MMLKKGIGFAIAAAIVSGFAVFVSSLATKVVKDPFVLTTSRNIIVAILFTSVLLGIWIFRRRHCEKVKILRSSQDRLRNLTISHSGKVVTSTASRIRFWTSQDDKAERDSSIEVGMTQELDSGQARMTHSTSSGQASFRMTTKQWLQLILIGIIGGSIPFLLFFQGLSLSTATSGAFIQKSLFIWVGILAVIFLREKLGIWQWLALAVLLIGNYFLGGPKSWAFGYGELLVFIATLFWAVEIVIVKKVIKNIPAIIIAWGRMFFGSLIMLGFLIATNRLDTYQTLNLTQWLWIILPSLLLFAYVGFWYTSLKYAPASLVTSILVLGAPITALLQSVFITHKYQLNQAIGAILIIVAIVIFIKFLPTLSRHSRVESKVLRHRESI